MGRPAKFNRDQAVEIVMNEIWKNGFQKSSVTAISEKLGITRSSFYNAFKSREALFNEVLDVYFSRTPDRVWSQVDEGTPILPLLTNMFKKVCRVRAADPEARGCMAVNFVAEMSCVDVQLNPKVESMLMGRLDRLERLLHQAAANGEIEDKGDLREKALALQNLLIGLNLMCKMVRSETDLWAGVQQTLKGLGLYSE
jgi:TetR/AcrR family transcriptional repressor of nem operon